MEWKSTTSGQPVHLCWKLFQCSEELCCRMESRQFGEGQQWNLLELTVLKAWRLAYGALVLDVITGDHRKGCVQWNFFRRTPKCGSVLAVAKQDTTRTDSGQVEYSELSAGHCPLASKLWNGREWPVVFQIVYHWKKSSNVMKEVCFRTDSWQCWEGRNMEADKTVLKKWRVTYSALVSDIHTVPTGSGV